MFDSGVTVIFVSHSIAQVKSICNKAILLNQGEIIAQGDANDVAVLYDKLTKMDKSNTQLLDQYIAEFNINQRKKQIEAEAKRSAYEKNFQRSSFSRNTPSYQRNAAFVLRMQRVHPNLKMFSATHRVYRAEMQHAGRKHRVL